MIRYVVRSVDDPTETFGEFTTGADAAILAGELKSAGRRVRIVREESAPEETETTVMYGPLQPYLTWRTDVVGRTWDVWAEENPGHNYVFARVPVDGVFWRLRESQRPGVTDIPWIREQWWRESEHTGVHYPHPSRVDPTKLAYTPSEEHGREDRQVRTRPGRYLREHFSDVLSEEQIQAWALKYATRFAPVDLEYASTPDEIEYVYTNGPSSCMAYGLDEYRSSIHPVRVYGAGDLAVAYIRNDAGEITGRALCWPERKEHGRVYGDVERMRGALDLAGFSEGPMHGARVLKLEECGAYILPYFDHGAVVDMGDHFEICDYSDADIHPESTDGIAPDHRMYCESCDSHADRDDAEIDPNGDPVCVDCFRNYCARCAECGETVWQDDAVFGPDDEIRCVDCHMDAVGVCEECGDDVMRDDLHTDPDDSERCDDCHADAVGECDDCGDDVMRDDLHTDPDDSERCDDCHADFLATEYGGDDDDDDGAPAPVRRPRARARARPDMSHPEQIVAALAPVIQGCANCGGARPLGWSQCRDCSRVPDGAPPWGRCTAPVAGTTGALGEYCNPASVAETMTAFHRWAERYRVTT